MARRNGRMQHVYKDFGHSVDPELGEDPLFSSSPRVFYHTACVSLCVKFLGFELQPHRTQHMSVLSFQ